MRVSKGAVIPKVSVRVTNAATGTADAANSNDAGVYIFPSLLPGAYRLTAESAGMHRYEARLIVQVQQSAVVEVVLQPAQTTTTVEVVDVTPLVISRPCLPPGLGLHGNARQFRVVPAVDLQSDGRRSRL